MSELDFKRIASDNWLEPDGTTLLFTGARDADQYVRVVLAARLSENVPKDVQTLFEVARAAILYGYFFYPLFTLGAEQLFRVGEAAVASKCEQLGVPKDRKTFSERIDWLAERGVFDRGEFSRWHTLRRLRNSASHPERQSIDTPGSAIGFLDTMAEDISALFGEEIQTVGEANDEKG